MITLRCKTLTGREGLIHIYFFLFIRSQISNRPFMSTINVFLCVLGVTRAACFLIDPYTSGKVRLLCICFYFFLFVYIAFLNVLGFGVWYCLFLLFVFVVLLYFFVLLLFVFVVLLSFVFVWHCCCFLIDVYTSGQGRLYMSILLYYILFLVVFINW